MKKINQESSRREIFRAPIAMPLLRLLALDAFERELSILETSTDTYVPVRTAETLFERDTLKLAQESKISLKVNQ